MPCPPARPERGSASLTAPTGRAPWRALVDALPHEAYLKDIALRYVAVNRALCHALRRSEADILGKTDLDLYPADVAERHRADDRLVLDKKQPVEREEQETVEGRPRTVLLLRAPVLDERGQLQGVAGLAWDVTPRAALEAQVQQAERLESVARLAGGVAHDFNNLLTVINGFSEILLGSLPTEGGYRELVDQIKQAGDRAADLTRRLLAFSRQQVNHPRLVDLNQTLTASSRLLRRTAGEGIDLELTLAAELAPLFLDPSQLEQVLQNLVSNARDAMAGGGRVFLQTALVQLPEEGPRPGGLRAGRYVVLTVRDTGHGMDPWVTARLFEPFFTTREFGKGTGLGLSIVHGIVRQNGGHVEVASEPGHGTTFTLYLPAFEGVLPESSLLAARWPHGDETVLVVEDEEIVRSLARRLLTQVGYTVVEAGDGAQALDAAARHPGTIHLLLSDVLMPQMNGPELARRLQVKRPGMKVVYLSGYAERGAVGPDLQQTGLALLHKPFTPDALLQKVRDVLDA